MPPDQGSTTTAVATAPPDLSRSSTTITITTDAAPSTPTIGTLRLRGGPRPPRQRVEWREDVVDNEGCGRKKSKICCIYHKPRRFDESSSESSSDSDGEDDREDESDDGLECHHHHHSHPRQAKEEKNVYEAVPSHSSGMDEGSKR